MMNRALRDSIEEDKAYYYGRGLLKRVYRMLTHNPLYQRGRYIIAARKAGYYSLHQKTIAHRILRLFYTRRKNVLGERIHVELGPSVFGRRLRLYHNDIVINAGTIIGDDCELYGNNCIGNKGSAAEPLGAPIIGNGVSIGVGAQVIGKVRIADNIRISSMSLVNKDLEAEGALYGGVPAKLIR